MGSIVGYAMLGVIGFVFMWIMIKLFGAMIPAFQSLFPIGSTEVYLIALIPTAIFIGWAYNVLQNMGMMNVGGNQQ